MSENGLGLVPRKLVTDKPFALRATPQFQAIVATRTLRHAFFRQPLHQGSEGTCAGHAGQAFLEAAPIIQTGLRTTPPNRLALQLYDEGWLLENSGVAVDRTTGLTLDALFKALRADRYVSEWRHVDQVQDVISWVGGVDSGNRPAGGPMILGIPWFNSMDSPSPDGTIRADPSSGLRGYHAVCVLAYNKTRDDLDFLNSWGDSWGRNGYGRVTRSGLAACFAHYGHGVTAAEVRRV